MVGVSFDYSSRDVLISSTQDKIALRGLGLIFPAACVVYTLFRGVRSVTFSCAFGN